MNKYFIREQSLIGEEALTKLSQSHVYIFGLGGVGSYVVEGLVRGGIKNFTLVDNDVFSESNINRQLNATTKTIGRKKTEVTKERILDINPECNVETIDTFVLKDNFNIDITNASYIVDAIDTISGKVEIIRQAKKYNIPVISCMGTGNKLDPTRFKITDISKTNTCPLAKVMRKLLKDEGIYSLKVLFSDELPLNPSQLEVSDSKKVVPGSISFVPSIAGLLITGEIIKDLIK